jgi:Vitamin B12 dependent methionine synthase, activation domain
MKNKSIILTPDYETIKPSLSEVGTIMGYTPGSEPSFVPEMLALLLEEAPSHVSAGGCYSIFELKEIKVPQGLILHSSGSLRCGSKIARQILGSDSFALFVTTAGNSFDSWIKSKAKGGDVLAEYLCSSIGSVIADKAADVVQEKINAYAVKAGKGITNRYSPGYCSWNVREQRGIFDLIPAEKIGVTLTPSFLMKPIKSVSGIIGIGPDKEPGPYMCDLCNMTNCFVKRARGL